MNMEIEKSTQVANVLKCRLYAPSVLILRCCHIKAGNSVTET